MRTQACGLILAFRAILTCEAAEERIFLQPDAASRLFHQVASKWVEESKIALKDSKADAEQLSQMQVSCTKVTNAFVAAAKGDRTKAIEYMDGVCNQIDDDLCKEFGKRLADKVEQSTSQDKVDRFCEAFWYGPLKDKAMGKAMASTSIESNSSSPLKALPHHLQSFNKLSEHGYSKKNSKDEIHLEAERIAAEAAVKQSQVHPHNVSKVHVAAKKLNKTVLKLNKDAEQKVKSATDAALKAAQASMHGKATKDDKKLQSSKNVAASKAAKARKKF